MNRVYLGLGSNLKTPERQIRLCLTHLRHLKKTTLVQVAPFYFNKAMGRKSMPNYCNTVVALNTLLSPLALLKQCQIIEKKQGRQRKVRWGARTIDIDMLCYGNRFLNHPQLKLPHPEFFNRDFVLVPFASIATM